MATEKLVESINRGDFSVVEPLLVPGSSLHKSQRDLVARLGREGVKEQTVGKIKPGSKVNSRRKCG
ncbi:MAG: hypothetical protein M1598_04410 [Actinobacteria bacterium]|nr:hypothetical protein [Actinomycetota bacterium]